jgi:hypothetical protein
LDAAASAGSELLVQSNVLVREQADQTGKPKPMARNGGAVCSQLRVVQQTNQDACGFHSLFNAITLGRALCAVDPVPICQQSCSCGVQLS